MTRPTAQACAECDRPAAEVSAGRPRRRVDEASIIFRGSSQVISASRVARCARLPPLAPLVGRPALLPGTLPALVLSVPPRRPLRLSRPPRSLFHSSRLLREYAKARLLLLRVGARRRHPNSCASSVFLVNATCVRLARVSRLSSVGTCELTTHEASLHPMADLLHQAPPAGAFLPSWRF